MTLSELADRLGAELRGDGARLVRRVADLQHADGESVSFLASTRYRPYLETTGAAAVILRDADAAACPCSALVTAEPYLAYARAAQWLHPPSLSAPGIHETAVIHPAAVIDATAAIGAGTVIEKGAIIGAGAQIGPHCVVGAGASIGPNSRLVAQVTIYYGSRLGARVLVHAGAVIGSDGFGFAKEGGCWVKIPQLGKVLIGDDVEIGANTTIDRGALGDTIIEEGVKLDNQIQIAHNVFIGAHTAIAGCVGIAGSTRIGKRCTIAGGVGIVGHIELADDVHITGMSLVSKSLAKPGVYSSGTPLDTHDRWLKNAVRFRQLDELARAVKALLRKGG